MIIQRPNRCIVPGQQHLVEEFPAAAKFHHQLKGTRIFEGIHQTDDVWMTYQPQLVWNWSTWIIP